MCKTGFPGGSDGKESACNAGELGLTPGLGKSPGEGKGYPFQYSCLENSMNGGAWQATIHGGLKQEDRTERPTLFMCKTDIYSIQFDLFCPQVSFT